MIKPPPSEGLKERSFGGGDEKPNTSTYTHVSNGDLNLLLHLSGVDTTLLYSHRVHSLHFPVLLLPRQLVWRVGVLLQVVNEYCTRTVRI